MRAVYRATLMQRIIPGALYATHGVSVCVCLSVRHKPLFYRNG